MRKLIILLLFIPFMSFGQSIEKYLISDNDLIFRQKSEIIAFSKKNGFKLSREPIDNGIYQMVSYFKQSNDYAIYVDYHFAGSERGSPFRIEKVIMIYPFSNIDENIFYNKIISKIKSQFLGVVGTSEKEYFKKEGVAIYDELIKTKFNRKSPYNGNESERYFKYGLGAFKSSEGESLNTIFMSIADSGMVDMISYAKRASKQGNKSFDKLRFTIGGVDLRDLNQYDLEAMVKFFLEDCKKNNINVPNINSLKATFEPLEGAILALAYGYEDDSIIKIKVDPEKWANSSIQKRWYVLYHELGHDILNLQHGQGGKMMFNFADREYTWDEFFEDKQYMINFK